MVVSAAALAGLRVPPLIARKLRLVVGVVAVLRRERAVLESIHLYCSAMISMREPL